jgi:hypothetical protein
VDRPAADRPAENRQVAVLPEVVKAEIPTAAGRLADTATAKGVTKAARESIRSSQRLNFGSCRARAGFPGPPLR